MENGTWTMEQSLDLGTTTFNFQGYSSDLSVTSSILTFLIVRTEEIVVVNWQAPIIATYTTGTTQFVSSTEADVSGTMEAGIATVFMVSGSAVTTTTNLSTTTWEVTVANLNAGANNLFFYGEDSAGNQSPSTSLNVFVDQEGPVMNSLSATSTGNIVNVEYGAADENLTVVSYEVQYLFPYVDSFNPQASCDEENTVIKTTDDPLLADQLALWPALIANNCIWFGFTTTTNNPVINFNPDLGVLSFYVRVRAVDDLNNYGEWQYTDLLNNNFSTGPVAIAEIAWMGTLASTGDEWIELCNAGEEPVQLRNWKLVWGDYNALTAKFDNEIILEETELAQYQCLLLERTDQSTVSDFDDSQIYAGANSLNNPGEHLRLYDPSELLIDEIDSSAGWFAGDNDTKASMTRKDWTISGNDADNWCTFTACNFPFPYTVKHDADGTEILGSPGDEPVAVM